MGNNISALSVYELNIQFMGQPITRRQLFSRKGLQANTPPPDPTPANPGNDPYFEKYANKTLPVSTARTTSGTNPYNGPFTEVEVLHLLRRTTFGARKVNVDQLKTMSPSAAVDFLIDNAVYPNDTPLNSYQSVYADTEGCPPGASWYNYAAPFNFDFSLTYFRTEWSFKPWWFGRMINQPAHILEQMTLFWMNFFGTQTADFNLSKAIWQHNRFLRNNALGNFRTIIKGITVDPHMLLFLNGTYNSAYAPDENYARELQELFTIGKGPASGFTENDVKAAARILTGWRRKDEPDGTYGSFFKADEHETNNKQFSAFYNNRVITGRSGAAGAQETDELIDMLLQHPECAKYLCRRLYRWFVYYVIDGATETNVIIPMANALVANNFNLVPVLKLLFKSEHFFDPLNMGCIIKSPVTMYAGMVREFNMNLQSSNVERQYERWRHFHEMCVDADQNVCDPPNVAGWRAYYQEPVYYQSWIGSDTIQKRARLLNAYARFGIDINGFKIRIDTVTYAKQFSNVADPNELVRQLALYLLPREVSVTQKNYMKSILLSNQASDHYWTDAWNAYIASPGNPVLEGQVRDRLDSLISYITGIEEYQLH
jgi:hypothetical protein